jgi:hypothetical protein
VRTLTTQPPPDAGGPRNSAGSECLNCEVEGEDRRFTYDRQPIRSSSGFGSAGLSGRYCGLRHLGDKLEAAGFEVKRFVKRRRAYGLERGACSRPAVAAEIGSSGSRSMSSTFVQTGLVHKVSGSGATEGCDIGMDMRSRKPIWGTLYSELAVAIATAWDERQAAASPSPALPAPVLPVNR